MLPRCCSVGRAVSHVNGSVAPGWSKRTEEKPAPLSLMITRVDVADAAPLRR